MIARLAAAVVVHALVQGALVLSNPTPEVRGKFELIAFASGIALVIGLFAMTAVMTGNRSLRILGLSAGIVALFGLAGILAPILTSLILILGLALIVSVASGVPLKHFKRGQSVIAVVGTLILGILAALAAVGLGFLVTGVVSAVLTWLLLGAVYCVLVRVWMRAAAKPVEV